MGAYPILTRFLANQRSKEMSLIGIPEKEIKATLAEVDATLKQVREGVLPKVDALVEKAGGVVSEAKYSLARLTEVTVQAEGLVTRLTALVDAISADGLTIKVRAGSSADAQ